MNVKDSFSAIAAYDGLPAGLRQELRDTGFLVLPGPLPDESLARLTASYDAAVDSADPSDVSVGSTTTRVHDFVNRGPEFDALYLQPALLEVCALVIGQPFRLSTMHARTVRPHSRAQDLHVDFERDASGWPMIGFILMVDEFRSDNGATRFIPGSHMCAGPPANLSDRTADYEGQVLACGPAGSMIVFNGSVWHGHTANRSDEPRRSLQGAYIRRDAQSGVNLPARMRPETLARIGPLAKYLLAL
jgi:ectoine hydroxylase-related dioxygenase (phytanoyl-CoA dioxygenase family)